MSAQTPLKDSHRGINRCSVRLEKMNHAALRLTSLLLLLLLAANLWAQPKSLFHVTQRGFTRPFKVVTLGAGRSSPHPDVGIAIPGYAEVHEAVGGTHYIVSRDSLSRPHDFMGDCCRQKIPWRAVLWVVDTGGVRVFDRPFVSIKGINERLIIAADSTGAQIFDVQTGTPVLGLQPAIYPLTERYVGKQHNDGKMQLYDVREKRFDSTVYDVVRPSSGGLLRFKRGDTVGLLDAQLRVLIAGEYDTAVPTLLSSVYLVSKAGKYGLSVPQRGWSSPVNFERVKWQQRDPTLYRYARITTATGQGIFDLQGCYWVIPPRYEWAGSRLRDGRIYHLTAAGNAIRFYDRFGNPVPNPNSVD